MTPILIGYFPKRTLKNPELLKAAGVEEVCSVSTCLSLEPDDWIDQWQHNEMWVYDTPELAWSVVQESIRCEFDLYAYKLFPVEFNGGQQIHFVIPTLQVSPIPQSFERLGFDAVSRSSGSSFSCSPLSCNGMANLDTTNRFCLVECVDLAFRMASEFEAGAGEPGTYFVVEVWRDSQTFQ